MNHSTIPLSRSAGGHSNTALTPWAPTFEELAEALSKPTVGAKDGSYFVRGPTNGTAIRADEHIPEANLVILDGDKRIDTETGASESGAPHPMLVHEALRDEDIPHIIYTSHSHGGDKGNRWRAVIPAPLGGDHAALLASVDHLIAILHRAAVPVAPARENYSWAQAWYFPRVRDSGAEFLTYAHDGGEALDVATILAQWQREAPLQPDVAPDKPRQQSADSLIGRYVAEHGTPQEMAQRLEAAGYLLKSAHTLNGAPCYRYLHPRSQTRQAGVLLFKARTGIWRVVSHHGDYDPLAAIDPKTGKVLAHDAFDVHRLLDHGGDLAKALRAIDPRPVIRVYGGSLRSNATQAIRALGKQSPPIVFQRGSLLARVAHLPETTELMGMFLPRGTATLVTLNPVDTRLRLADAARFERAITENGEVVWTEADPPGPLAQAILSAQGEWGSIPVLTAIAEAPVIRHDGSLFDQQGYDPQTRLYSEGRSPRLAVPDHPDLEAARSAAELLLAPFAEFPFADPALDRSIVLSYLLTLAQRPSLPLAPLFGVSATAPGSGKGLLVEVCNLVARGRDAAIMPPPGGMDGEAETRKRITALLLQGVSSVLLDNWTSAIGGDSMNALLTSAQWSDRILGQSQTVTLPSRVTWAATGNNLTVRGDMVRRTLLAVIDPRCERPEQRSFQVRNLTQAVMENRAALLSALFTILRAYRLAGEPERDGPTLGRFEAWSRAVCAPIRWLGWPDPVLSQDRLRADDPESLKLAALLSAWAAVFRDRSVTVSELIEGAMGDGYGAPSHTRLALREALEDAAGDRPGQINRRKLGWYLRHFHGRVCDGLALFIDQSRQNALRYRVGQAPSLTP